MLGRGLGESVLSVAGRSPGDLLRVWGGNESACWRRLGREALSMGLSVGDVCIRAMANSRSIILTSRVVRRWSRVTLSSCCIVLTKVATFGGVVTGSGRWSEPIRDGAAESRVTLVTVVPVDGLAD